MPKGRRWVRASPSSRRDRRMTKAQLQSGVRGATRGSLTPECISGIGEVSQKKKRKSEPRGPMRIARLVGPPRYVYILITKTYECYLRWQKRFCRCAEIKELESYAGSSGWPQRETEGRFDLSRGEGRLTTEAEIGVMHFEDGRGGHSHGLQGPLDAESASSNSRWTQNGWAGAGALGSVSPHL